jgi:hypothetical protein
MSAQFFLNMAEPAVMVMGGTGLEIIWKLLDVVGTSESPLLNRARPGSMMRSALLAGVASVAAFSSTPDVITLTPDVVVTAESQNCDGR